MQVTGLPWQGLPADYVSRSVGYDWPNLIQQTLSSPSTLIQTLRGNSMFSCPDPSCARGARSAAAVPWLCYAGSHQEKYLAIFTDKRGGKLLLTPLCCARALFYICVHDLALLL